MAVSLDRFFFGVSGWLQGRVSDEVAGIILGMISPPTVGLTLMVPMQYEYCLGTRLPGEWQTFVLGLDAAANSHFVVTPEAGGTLLALHPQGVCSPTSGLVATLARALADFRCQCCPQNVEPQEVVVADVEGKPLVTYFRLDPFQGEGLSLIHI